MLALRVQEASSNAPSNDESTERDTRASGRSPEPRLFSTRHNFIDRDGVIHLTPIRLVGARSRPLGRRSRSSAVKARRSSNRNDPRPAATLINGSTGATFVHPTGNERVRPFGPTYITRSSPQLNRYVSSSNVCPWSGWKGCVTMKTCGRWASRGAMRGLFQGKGRARRRPLRQT